MSNERSPRESCSTTIGTMGMCLFLLVGLAAEPAHERGASEAPVVADLAAGQRAFFCHRDDSSRVAAEQFGGFLGREDLLDGVREELVLADGEVVLHEVCDQILLRGAELDRGAGELVSCVFGEAYVERAPILLSR